MKEEPVALTKQENARPYVVAKHVHLIRMKGHSNFFGYILTQ